jgi:hypothetical protein
VATKPDPTLPKIGARLALTRRALSLTRFQMARQERARTHVRARESKVSR